MKCRSIPASLFRRKSLFAVGAALLVLTPHLLLAAPDQPRLNKPLIPKQTPRHSVTQSRSPAECPARADAFSDRAFLSAELARQSMAADMAQGVLSHRGKTDPQVELWAQRLLKTTQRSTPKLEALLLAEGGLDRKVYTEAREALLPQKRSLNGQSVPYRFIMFLIPYCEQTMEAAIPALLKASQNEAAEMASDLLSELAKLSLEVRDWLHTHHYRNDI